MGAENRYSRRLIATVLIEAESPLAVGSGEKDIMTDAMIMRDVNGLPYIPGSTIAGLVRHALEDVKDREEGETLTERLFGYQKGKEGHGSHVIFSEARLVGQDGKVCDGLGAEEAWKSTTAIRQHNRIGEKGTVEGTGKFDQEVVLAGSRFVFEIEMMAKADEDNAEGTFDRVLSVLSSETFRIGGGSTKGYGKVNVVREYKSEYDLTNEKELDEYLNRSSRLGTGKKSDREQEYEPKPVEMDGRWQHYRLVLKPQDFVMFGSGFGNKRADMTRVKESRIIWKADGTSTEVENSEETLLIPASGVKGALRHRTAYHYNKKTGRFADGGHADDKTANNEAVAKLFGKSGDGKSEEITKGCLLFSDIFVKLRKGDVNKVMNHVAINRFTGGAFQGALFSDEPVYAPGLELVMDIYMDKREVESRATENNVVNKDVIESFEQSLKDLTDGLLPLGGGVGRGHGVFTGNMEKR